MVASPKSLSAIASLNIWPEDKFEILWMEEILHQLKMVVYPIILIGF